MRDHVRLIVWMVVDLFRSRAALEAEILTLRQQINVLRRAAPKKQTFSSIDRLIFVCLYRLLPRLAMRWRSSSRIRSSVGIARVSECIGAGSRDVVVADQLYHWTYASLSTR